MRFFALLLALSASGPLAAAPLDGEPAGDGPFAVAPVAESELATMRGGFRLPNGIDVSMTVQTQTAIDGAVVLRTIFRADQGPPTLAVYVPRDGTVVAAGRPGGSGGQTTVMPSVSLDPRGVIEVTPGVVTPTSVNVSTGSNQGGIGDVPEGLETAGDTVRQQTVGNLRTAAIDAADISIVHFAGAAFGSAIVNSGSDRMIETQTSIAIDLRNAGPDVLGSSMLRAQGLTDDALALRGF